MAIVGRFARAGIVAALIGAGPALAQDTGEAALAQFRRGDAAGAEAVARRAVEADPDDAVAWFVLGLALHQRGAFDEAIDADTRAAAKSTLAASAVYNRACAKAKLGRVDDAVDDLVNAYRLGFHDRSAVEADDDLAAVREHPRFRPPQGRERLSFAAGRDGAKIEFVRILPPGYEPGKKYPALIALPPGAQDMAAVGAVLTSYWGEQAAQRGWVVYAPAAPPSGWMSARGRSAFSRWLDDIEANCPPEGGGFHLAGSSNGGNAAWSLAQAMPRRILSITVIPGSTGVNRLDAVKGIKVRQYVGERDTKWVESARRTQDVLKLLAVDAELTIVPGDGHFVESYAADRLIEEMEQLRRRDAAPT